MSDVDMSFVEDRLDSIVGLLTRIAEALEGAKAQAFKPIEGLDIDIREAARRMPEDAHDYRHKKRCEWAAEAIVKRFAKLGRPTTIRELATWSEINLASVRGVGKWRATAARAILAFCGIAMEHGKVRTVNEKGEPLA